MLFFRCRTEIPKLDLESARVHVSQLFKKTALVKIKAAESLRRFVNLTSFKSVWQQSWDLLVVVQLRASSSETNSLCQENPPSSQESTRIERWNNPSQLSPWLQPPWTWQVVVHLEFQTPILKTKQTGCDGISTLITYLCYNCNMDSIPDICFQFECIYKSLRVYRSSIPLKNLFKRTLKGSREAAAGVSAETWMNSIALGEPHPVFTIFNSFRLMILISIAGKCE